MAKPAKLSTVGIFAKKGGAAPASLQPAAPAGSGTTDAVPPSTPTSAADGQEPPRPAATPVQPSAAPAAAPAPVASVAQKRKPEADDRIAMTYKAPPLQYERMQKLIGIRGKPYRHGQDLMYDAIEAWLAGKGV